MKLTLPILTVTAILFAGIASAFDPDDLQKLKDTGECKKCDLTSANLKRANLSSADLRDAFLREVFLVGGDLSGANLSKAYMKGAILCNTTMPDGSVIYSGC